MSRRGETVRLATRGSDLALRQAALVKEALEGRRREVELLEVETRGDEMREELIHRLGKTGAFVRSLDEEVLAGEADAAVHSMKDVPTEQPDGLVIAAVPERASPGDLLVTPDGRSLDELPEGATVGTASLRRRAQLLNRRPDLDVQPLRGNVDTRVEKLLAPHRQREHQRRLEAAETGPESAEIGSEAAEAVEVDSEGAEASSEAAEAGAEVAEAGSGDAEASSGDAVEPKADPGDGESGAGPGDGESGAGPGDDAEPPAYDLTPEEWFDGLSEIERRALGREVGTEYDAVVLAAAGLERSGLRRQVPTHELPTDAFVPAAGQGAIAVTTRDDEVAEAVRRAVDHPRSRVETTAERAVLAELGGGCVAPIGVYAVVQGEYVHVAAQVADRDGEEVLAAQRDLPIERHAAAARELGRDLRADGAAELVEAARREAGEGEAKRAEDGDDGGTDADGGDETHGGENETNGGE